MTTPPTGLALKMRTELRDLSRRHGLSPKPITVPLTMATNHPMILEGYAHTVDLDLDRTKIRGWAFGPPWMLRQNPPPLYYKHDPKQVAGKIVETDYDLEGNLLVRAEVHHPLALRAGAFSVAATVRDYELRETQGPGFFAVIKRATLDEISLTDTPANPNALVMNRHRKSPNVECLELLSAKIGKLVQLTEFIKEQVHADVHRY